MSKDKIQSFSVSDDTIEQAREILSACDYTSQEFKDWGLSDSYIIDFLKKRRAKFFFSEVNGEIIFQVLVPAITGESKAKTVRGNIRGALLNKGLLKNLFETINNEYLEIFAEPAFDDSMSAYGHILEQAGFVRIRSKQALIGNLNTLLGRESGIEEGEIDSEEFSYQRTHPFNGKIMNKVLMVKSKLP